jgi:hypothetical protein
MRKLLLMAMVLITSLATPLEAASQMKLEVITPDLSSQSKKKNDYGQVGQVVSKDDLILLEYQYNGSYYKRAAVHFYFKNIGQNGSVDFKINLEEKVIGPAGMQPLPGGSEKSADFNIVKGKKYNLQVPIYFVEGASTAHSSTTINLYLREYTIIWIFQEKPMNRFVFQVPATRGLLQEPLQLIEMPWEPSSLMGGFNFNSAKTETVEKPSSISSTSEDQKQTITARPATKEISSSNEMQRLLEELPELVSLKEGLPAYYIHVSTPNMPIWDNKMEAQELLSELHKKIDPNVQINSKPYARSTKYTVFYGPYSSKLKAARMAKKLKDAGYSFIIKLTPNA